MRCLALVTHLLQVSADIEALKKTISDLQEAVKSAKARQEETKAEIKKLEKDIDEFKNNKEGKIDELKVRAWKHASSRLLLTYNHFRLRSRS